MCKKRKDTLAVNPEPRPRTPVISSISGGSAIPSFGESSSEIATDGAREGVRLLSFKPSSSGSSDHLSVASLREALPEKPNLYEFSEIFAATRSPDARRLSSSSSSSWRCSIRGKDVVIVQRRFLGDPSEFRRRVVAATSVHHKNIVRILGAVLGGDDLFLVYEYVNGASLRECLRSPRNPGYTLLATWIERMQVATDIAQGLQYIHHFTTSRTATPLSPHQGSHRCPVHDRIKSSSIMITEIGRRAKICHFGAVELSRATYEFDCDGDGIEKAISGDHSTVVSPKMRRSSSRKVKFEGARGYIAPEIRQGGPASQKSDVYAFGVVLLELLTGEEPVKYTYNRESKGYEMVSQIESARRLMEVEKQGQEHESEPESLGNDLPEAENNRRIRSWVDPRLKDSFPVDVVERVIQVALQCVEPEAEKRPDMVRVAAKLSAFLMQSKTWAEKMGFPEELTVSLAPR